MKENPLAKRPHPVYKDVVVIGNGPSGLAMSYVLAGRTPRYNGRSHPDAILNAALRNTLQKGAPLTTADLAKLAQVLEPGSSSTPVGTVMDQLVRPGADSGIAGKPVIDWVTSNPCRQLTHVVIGKGPPGGTWKKMDGRTMTLSLSSWMELPGLPIHESEAGRRAKVPEEGARVATSTIADYYQEYVYRMGLTKYQRRGAVTSVAEYDDTEETESDKKIHWVVEGRDLHDRKFRYLSKFVVLACGTNDSPNSLGVPGEELPWVHHTTRALDEYLRNQKPSPEEKKVLVVGSGLSACDAVLSARSHGANILHLFRGTAGLSRWLPLTSYPEYLAVHSLMTGTDSCPRYRGANNMRIVSLTEPSHSGQKAAILESSKGHTETVEVTAVAILVGSTANLSFLPRDDLGVQKGPIDSRSNPIDLNLTTYELNRLPHCYAVGPLAGDMFVRHILGGVVAAAAHISKAT